MTTKPTERQEDSLDGMIDELKNGLAEDFSWTSKEQAQAILDKLKAKVNAITIEDFLEQDE